MGEIAGNKPDTILSCPDCEGTRLEKYGRTRAGLQKYRCLNAAGHPSGRPRQLVPGSRHIIDAKTKSAVVSLLAGNTKPEAIKAAFPEIPLRWIYELRRRTPR